MDTIKLWVENRLDNEIDKPFSDVLEEFKSSEYYKDYIFEPHTTVRSCLLRFITAKDGLNASYDVENPTAFEALYEYVREGVKRV